MLSRSRSHVFSRKGSIERSKVSKEGCAGSLAGSRWMSSSEVGRGISSESGGAGIWCRKDVRRWELWTTTGTSTRISLNVSLDFWRLYPVQVSTHHQPDETNASTSPFSTALTDLSVVNLLSLKAVMNSADNRNARRLKAPWELLLTSWTSATVLSLSRW